MGPQARVRVPEASFSRLSATNVLFGLTWAQIIVGLAGLAVVLIGAVMGLNWPVMVSGALVMTYGLGRYQGLSWMAWTWIWWRWRKRLRTGENRWAYSPLAAGRPLGVLGLWGRTEDRAQAVEGRSAEVIGTPFDGACYLWDPDKRQATATLTANVEEWMFASNTRKRSRAMALNNMLKNLSETPGAVELKETSFVLPGPTPPMPEYASSPDTPQWTREDLADLWTIPDILTPLQNVNYISVSVAADKIVGEARKSRTERAAVGIALGGLVKQTIGPDLLACGARERSVHWCGVDDLRSLIRTVADPERASDRVPLDRDDPTVTWCEEAKAGDFLTLDSCVARTHWVFQWPIDPVAAGWIRDLVSDRRMMAFCHIWRPMSKDESENEMAKREQSIKQRSRLQDQRKKSSDERREEKEQAQRELEQEAGWPDTDHQGFITLFARDLPELQAFDKELQQKAKEWKMKLSSMKGRQRAALTTVLPLGI